MTHQLPLAPKGFAWMPIVGEYAQLALAQALVHYPLTGRPVEDSWKHMHYKWAVIGEPVHRAPMCRLMRRLGPCEKPWTKCFNASRSHAEWVSFSDWGVFDSDDKEEWSLEETHSNWYAPVRFATGHVPDFGEEGLRYIDDFEPLPHRDDCRWLDPQTLQALRAEAMPQADPDELCSVCALIEIPRLSPPPTFDDLKWPTTDVVPF